jgi:hypothetical protein
MDFSQKLERCIKTYIYMNLSNTGTVTFILNVLLIYFFYKYMWDFHDDVLRIQKTLSGNAIKPPSMKISKHIK